jgi:hypothetical protein
MNKYLKTYIRNRNITLDNIIKLNSTDLGVKYYELDYVDIDIRDIEKRKIPEVILNRKILDKYFLNQTEYKNITDYNFSNQEISIILANRPEYIEYFKDKLSNFEKKDINWVLSFEPSLADYFNLEDFNQGDYENLVTYDKKNILIKKFRHKIRFYLIRNYLKDHPEDYMDFIDILKQRGVDNIDDLIFWQPEILKHMDVDDIHYNLRYREVEDIIKDFPHMKKFFEDIGYL